MSGTRLRSQGIRCANDFPKINKKIREEYFFPSKLNQPFVFRIYKLGQGE